MPNFFISCRERVRLDVGIETNIAFGVTSIVLCLSILSYLQLMDLHLHFPILLNQFLNILHRHRSLLQLLIFFLERYQLSVDIVRTHPLPFQIQQLLEITDFLLQLTDYFHTLSIELHWLNLHHYLHKSQYTCLALSTNLRVFIV